MDSAVPMNSLLDSIAHVYFQLCLSKTPLTGESGAVVYSCYSRLTFSRGTGFARRSGSEFQQFHVTLI